MTNSQPKPCPFCRGASVRAYSDHNGQWMVDCSCGARGPRSITRAGAVALWNVRCRSNEACYWTLTPSPDYGVWELGCGESWQFESGGPKENKMQFCCYCSKPLVERILTVDDDDDTNES